MTAKVKPSSPSSSSPSASQSENSSPVLDPGLLCYRCCCWRRIGFCMLHKVKVGPTEAAIDAGSWLTWNQKEWQGCGSGFRNAVRFV